MQAIRQIGSWRIECRSTGSWSQAVRGMAILAVLLAASRAAAAQIVIDSFSTNQSALTLTYPPAGTTASSSVSGSGILGGERDLAINLTGGVIAGNTMSATVSSGFFSYSQDATIAGTGSIQWDGTDGSATLNPTGLGGVDLTAGGTQDAVQMSVFFDDLPINVTIEVFTDAGNASTATIALPGLLFSSTNFVIPYSSFVTTLGAGADFSSVGAIVLTLGSNVTAPDVVLDFIQTAALVNASSTVADINGHSKAQPGDTLRYTVVVSNPTDATGASATGAVLTNAAPANTTLVVGSVTSTQGTVTTGNTAGDSSVAVNLGTIADGATATVTFDVMVNSPIPAGVTMISSQGTVTTATLTGGVLTDDPTQPGASDPTVFPTAAATSLSALASPSVTVGGSISDQASLSGAGSPTGTLTFNLYAGSDASCAHSLFTTTTAVSGDGTYTSNSVVPATAGTYQWVASYGGDANNLASATVCGDPTQSVVVAAPPVAPVATIPTLSGWGLISLALLLAGVGLTKARMRLRGE